ncbi:MAG: 3'-5' exonuclease [Chitinophagaceae bacterium]|nr:3'-5' exonuclease [Chitinophagaceae bacterium]
MSPYPLHNILFVDIETVPQYPEYDNLGTEWKELWGKKAEILLRNREDETIESIYNRAGIYAEFGKIICISCGVIQGTGDDRKLLLKSFAGDSEQVLLHEFSEMLRKWAGNETKYLCAHNGKEFDFPYLCRRMIINGLSIPTILNSSGKKPWEVNFLDTMELWKFGDFKNYTSLSLLATALSIPTPKDDIDGSMVGEVYWKERNIDRIANYCQKDVATTVQVFLKMMGELSIKSTNIEIKL